MATQADVRRIAMKLPATEPVGCSWTRPRTARKARAHPKSHSILIAEIRVQKAVWLVEARPAVGIPKDQANAGLARDRVIGA